MQAVIQVRATEGGPLMGTVPDKAILPPFPMPPIYRLAADVWRCDFCGGHRSLSALSCEGCGAPRSGPLTHSGSDVRPRAGCKLR